MKITQYIQEAFIKDRVQRIRKLTGHTNDIITLLETANELTLNTELTLLDFDEYLQKQSLAVV